MSKLYELEDRFDSEYTEIMDLFRESNVVYKTAVNYYSINVTRTVSGAVSSPILPVVVMEKKTKNIAPHVMACKRCEGKGRIFTWTREELLYPQNVRSVMAADG